MSFPAYAHYKDSGVEWLGEVPAHWETKRIKHLVQSFEQGWSPQCEGYPVESSEEWGVLKVGCVNGGAFRRDENKALPADIEPIPALGISAGDLLISRANTRELVGSAAVAEQDYSNLLLCDKLYRVRLKPKVCDPRFLGLYLGTEAARGQIELAATGASSSMVNIGQSTILEMQLSLPAHEEQLQIAAFLQRETTKLDALITEQRTLIDLLKEKRQAVISHAVTKGLDPRVPMKDSGVEWLGEVPAHWVRTPLKFTVDAIIDTEHKTVEFHDDGEYMVARTSNIKFGKLQTEDAKYTDEAGYIEWTRRGVPEPGDIILTREAPAGEACIVPGSPAICLGQRTVLLKINKSKLDSRYGLWSIYGGLASEFISDLAQGSTVSHFNMSDIGNIPILLPTLQEQGDIAGFIDDRVSRLDALTAEAQTTIALLQERRSALISAAVTGKIDVRQAA